MADGGKIKRRRIDVEDITTNDKKDYVVLRDKLGRRLHAGQYIIWFTDRLTGGKTTHLAFIESYDNDEGFIVHPIKSSVYIQDWEKAIEDIGLTDNLKMTNAKLDLERLTTSFGVFILDELNMAGLLEYPHINN